MAQTPQIRSRRLKPVPEPLIGSFLLESITTGMYGERKNAIREYVQNGFDGIQSAIESELLRKGAGKITLTLAPDKKSLIILDNGAGIPHRVAVNTLTAVGASRKERGQQAGFRGIGRLAGIAFSDLLQFRTKASGDQLETIVQFDCIELRKGMLFSGRKPAGELIAACTSYEQRAADDEDAHYFEVSLMGLRNAPAEATDPIQMRSFLSQVAPVDFHPDFRGWREHIFGLAEEELIPDADEDEEDDTEDEERPDWSVLEDDAADMLERIPVPCVAVSIVSGSAAREEKVFKPYKPEMAVAGGDDVPLSEISVHSGASGTWWGWIGHKVKPGDYQNDAVAGLRIRLKNLQIDGNELITLVPSENKIRNPFSSWSNWFVGEIHVDPRAVVPNARRDNFEEDPRWLAIREEISSICHGLTKEARKVSSDHQSSVEVITKKTTKIRENYFSITRAKVFSAPKAVKLLDELDKVMKDIAKATDGAPAGEQIELKSLSKELTQVRTGLLEKPKTPEYERFRDAIRAEFLEKTLKVLNAYLDIEDFDDVKKAIEKALR